MQYLSLDTISNNSPRHTSSSHQHRPHQHHHHSKCTSSSLTTSDEDDSNNTNSGSSSSKDDEVVLFDASEIWSALPGQQKAVLSSLQVPVHQLPRRSSPLPSINGDEMIDPNVSGIGLDGARLSSVPLSSSAQSARAKDSGRMSPPGANWNFFIYWTLCILRCLVYCSPFRISILNSIGGIQTQRTDDSQWIRNNNVNSNNYNSTSDNNNNNNNNNINDKNNKSTDNNIHTSIGKTASPPGSPDQTSPENAV